MTFAELLAWANVILALGIGIVQWRCAQKVRGHGYWWLKIGSSIIGFYWFGLYLFVAFANPDDFNNVIFSQTFVRPAFTLTLGLMLAGAIYKMRSNGCKK